ncbi:MAG: hypothetical protein BWY57_00780 [Betaproteobacteria bacterium ADurb.Bin341]|nr:MAG: hypothetical protein BWY57_00780 [Betaproteobacteria bacterium ADurb.Bin341]
MTASHPVFLLLGFASEYSLGAIANLLRNAGENVFEVDFSISEIPDLGDTEVVLITSQHPARTSSIFRHGNERASAYKRYLSPMECMQRFNVCCSVFIPHDLEQPIITDEIAYLSFFDIYCSPYEFNPGLSLLCTPLYTGWSKHVGIDTGEFTHQGIVARNGVFFVNQLIDLMGHDGAKYLLDKYGVAVSHEVPFKFPNWPGVSNIEREMEQTGALVIPANTPSTQVIIHSAQVFSNTNGSVLAEAAYLGVPAHIIQPHATALPSPTPRGQQRQPFNIQLLLQSIQNHINNSRIT